MPFWRKDTPEEIRQKEAQEKAIKALESGDIPPIAKERLERERKHGSGFFTSDLSCREFLLIKEAGIQTLGQVMGTSFFRTRFGGTTNFTWNRSTREFDDLTAVQTNSRETALNRMKREAQLLGATGVVGVRIMQRGHSWSGGLTEFTAIGTAIKIPGWDHVTEPFTSTLNGQEFWQLYQAGCEPQAVVYGVCSYYIYTDAATRSILYTWLGNNNRTNQEVVQYTQGFYLARSLAYSRMLLKMQETNAEGVIDVDFDPDFEVIEYEVNNREQHDLLCNFVIMGTAIRKATPRVKSMAPLMCLNLSTRTFGKLGSTGDWDYDTVIAPDTRTGARDDEDGSED